MRKSMSETECQNKSESICTYIQSMPEYHNANCILLYHAINHEVDLKSLFHQALKDQKQIYYPKTTATDLLFYRITDINEMRPGYFGIMEPDETTELLHQSNCNGKMLIIVPGVAFSEKGHRIGYGKGYYDRFLKDFDGISVGVGYHFQLESDFETSELDIPLHFFVSELGIVNVHPKE
ncbi:MAG: 5-formyltetrahydrofolate cyclo-ligase [Agathobacter sp.]|nr:5-formyltetrahydrofolate cyclo-ligase [Agathobacter sp.]